MHPRIANAAADSEEPTPFDLKAWRREQAQHLIDTKVPARFADATPEHPTVRAWVDLFLADPTTCPSLLLSGLTGTGKTHQMYGALKAVLRGRADQGLGLNFRVTSHPDLNEALRPKPNNANAYALDPYLGAELVLLDDLGAGKQTEWTADGLYRLVDHRWTAQLPTIFTTNLEAKEMASALGDRIISRLGEPMKVKFMGADRRWAK